MFWDLQYANISTVFICLEKEDKDEETRKLIKRPALNGQMVQSGSGIMDVVGYLDIDQNGERRLHVNPSQSFYAKHRTTKDNRIVGAGTANFEKLKSRLLGVNAPVKENKKIENPIENPIKTENPIKKVKEELHAEKPKEDKNNVPNAPEEKKEEVQNNGNV